MGAIFFLGAFFFLEAGFLLGHFFFFFAGGAAQVLEVFPLPILAVGRILLPIKDNKNGNKALIPREMLCMCLHRDIFLLAKGIAGLAIRLTLSQ